MTALVTRILSALVLAPVALGAVYLGGSVYLAVLALAGILMAHELVRLVHAGCVKPQMFLHALVVVLAIFGPALTALGPTAAVAGAIWLASIALTRRSGRGNPWAALTIPYLFVPLISLVVLRLDQSWGLAAVLFVLAVTWATDIAAYFSGRLIGGPKLSPTYSPNKTWAGLAGGVCAAAATGVVAAALIGGTSGVMLGVLGGIFAIVAQLGDIAESAMKRFFRVKDSGTLIPGHGGILDRVDGLVAVATMACAVGAAHAGAIVEAASGLLNWRF